MILIRASTLEGGSAVVVLLSLSMMSHFTGSLLEVICPLGVNGPVTLVIEKNDILELKSNNYELESHKIETRSLFYCPLIFTIIIYLFSTVMQV